MWLTDKNAYTIIQKRKKNLHILVSHVGCWYVKYLLYIEKLCWNPTHVVMCNNQKRAQADSVWFVVHRSVVHAAAWWNGEQLPAVESLWAFTLRSSLSYLEEQHWDPVPDLPLPAALVCYHPGVTHNTVPVETWMKLATKLMSETHTITKGYKWSKGRGSELFLLCVCIDFSDVYQATSILLQFCFKRLFKTERISIRGGQSDDLIP